jgi:uncharacterized membrane protein
LIHVNRSIRHFFNHGCLDVPLVQEVTMERAIPNQEADRSLAGPSVRTVPAASVPRWLRLGARDLRRSPGAGLTAGVLAASAGLLLTLLTWKAVYLAPALLGGFLIAAPLLAMPLYAVSRRLERGEADGAAATWSAWRGNGGSICMFGLVLALVFLFWERVAAILFAFSFSSQPVLWSALPVQLLQGGWGGFLLAFFLAGGTLAGVVFALGVVTAPLLTDRPVDVVTAMLTSLRCCARNPLVMLLWGATIGGLTLLGIAACMLGLVVVFPWLAHASWHAYRELVEPQG